MKTNAKGITIPNVFLMPFHGTRQKAMELYCPEEGEHSFPDEEFWTDQGEQDWMGIMATREEVGILQKVLRGEELTGDEKDFAQHLAVMIDVTWEAAQELS